MIQVILGGGRKKFLPLGEVDPESENTEGRLDKKNLIDSWLQQRKEEGAKAKYMWHKDDLLSDDTKEMDYLLG